MRLIDADAVKFNFQYGRDDNGILLVPFRDAKKAIEAAKTVDAVPVVRCKDCKYLVDAVVNSNGFLICDISDMEITPEDFCSYGERKEGDTGGS